MLNFKLIHLWMMDNIIIIQRDDTMIEVHHGNELCESRPTYSRQSCMIIVMLK